MIRINTDQTTWNFKELYESDYDPQMEKEEKQIKEKSYKFINKWNSRTDYLKDPKILKEALDEYEEWKRNCGADGNIGYYFWLRTQQEQNDTDLKAKHNKIVEFGKKIENDIQFFSFCNIFPGDLGSLPTHTQCKAAKWPFVICKFGFLWLVGLSVCAVITAYLRDCLRWRSFLCIR